MAEEERGDEDDEDEDDVPFLPELEAGGDEYDVYGC